MFIKGRGWFFECFTFFSLIFVLASVGNQIPQTWAIEKNNTGDIIGSQVLVGLVSSVAQWGW